MTTHDWTSSPAILTDGAWVRRGHVLRWVEAPARKSPEAPIRITLACTTCGAMSTDFCRTESGKTRLPHEARTLPRTCACGVPLDGKFRYCDECRLIARRKTWEKRAEKKRLAALEVERFGRWQDEARRWPEFGEAS